MVVLYPCIIANAVHHRSYQIPEPITVTVTPEKLEILSFPGPDRSISDESIEMLRIVATRYRNRRIGEFLKELRLVEGRNTGIPSMLRALESNGSPPPIFETDNGRSYFRVTILVHEAFSANNNNNNDHAPTHDHAPAAAPNAPNAPDAPAAKRRKKSDVKTAILDALSTDPLPSRALAKKAGYSTHRSGAFYRVVSELVAEGKVAYTVPDKPRDGNQMLEVAKGDG